MRRGENRLIEPPMVMRAGGLGRRLYPHVTKGIVLDPATPFPGPGAVLKWHQSIAQDDCGKAVSPLPPGAAQDVEDKSLITRGGLGE